MLSLDPLEPLVIDISVNEIVSSAMLIQGGENFPIARSEVPSPKRLPVQFERKEEGWARVARGFVSFSRQNARPRRQIAASLP